MPLEDEDPLAAALSQAFVSSPSLRPQNTTQLDAGTASTSTLSSSTDESSVSSDPVDSDSQREYESQVESWRAQSAEARQKAEKERARWEAIRAAEKQEAALRNAALPADSGVSGETDQGWETVGARGGTQEVPRPSSPSPADVRDLVTGEPQKHVVPTATAEASKPQSTQDTGDESSHKWEEVSDPLTSSFPSMSFPDRTNTPSPHPPPPAPVESATLAIFDSSLSTRTRLTALVFVSGD
ncbi:hypothetical protein MSAN_00380100 [Mycena sanguinolenta]|uniref:Uncharacterized protein n=1 Tax=Mycena sanguinolenta TaxID=230812 RepID=A0A8H6Z9D8_9AGAR|nr:hypothetical protein MSAN_00380100 [Mycena sanguinolenta]